MCELMGDPITCNTANVRHSLKIIHLMGRSGLPHCKVHLKHCGFEEVLVSLKENVHFKRTALYVLISMCVIMNLVSHQED